MVVTSEFSRLLILQAMARLLLRATRTVTDGLWAWRWASAQQRKRRLSQLNNALKRVAQIRKSDGGSGDSESDLRRSVPGDRAIWFIALERPDGAGMLLAVNFTDKPVLRLMGPLLWRLLRLRKPQRSACCHGKRARSLTHPNRMLCRRNSRRLCQSPTTEPSWRRVVPDLCVLNGSASARLWGRTRRLQSIVH